MNQNDFLNVGAQIIEELGDWKNSEGLSPEARARIIARVEEIDRKEQAKKKVKPFRMKKRYVIALAAVLSLLMGTAVVGDRAWISDGNDLERDSEVTTKVNTDEKDSTLLEEEVMYREIGEKLGIAPMWLGYMPDGMVLDSYAVGEGTGWAYVNYLYNGNLVCVQMAKSSIETSSNVQWDGNAEPLEYTSNWYDMEVFCLEEGTQKYGASIAYGNGYYNIWGSFSSKEEFFAILEEIYFKTV